MKKTQIVYTKKLANYLKKAGFNLITTEINFKNPEFYIFVFEYSDALMEAINNYKNTKCDSYE